MPESNPLFKSLANSLAEERAADDALGKARKAAKEAERTASLAQRRYDTAKKQTDDVRLGKA